MAYSLLFGLTLVLTLYTNYSLNDRIYYVISVLLAASLFGLLFLYGLPNGRWIGGVHPNTVGAFALSLAYFAARSRSNLRWLLFAVALGFAALISSRFAVVSILIIAMADYLTHSKLSSLRLSLNFIAFSLGLAILLAFWDIIVNDVLQMYDPDRGIGSGLSGRMDLVDNFWTQFVSQPVIGYGFRARDGYVATHNGHLNFLLENGIVGSILLAAAVLSSIYRTILNFRITRDSRFAVRISFWIAWLFSGFLMPQLINFGDAFALFSLFLLTDDRQNFSDSNPSVHRRL